MVGESGGEANQAKMGSKRPEGKDFKKGIKTGVHGWEQYVEPESGRAYFRNHYTKVSSWGLPLRDVLKNDGVSGPTGNDDWQCFVDTETQKRFYQSKRNHKVQWRIPHVYTTTIGKLDYFTKEFAEKQRKKLAAKQARKLRNEKLKEQARKVRETVSIEQVLEDSVLCAAFHRYLISVYAEENLLFYGAIQVFEKGSFHGMDVMGIENKETKDEGDEMLQKQLVMSRASVRIGVPLKRTSLKDEARIVYEKFLKPEAEMWVCVEQSIAKEVEENIVNASEEDDLRGIFEDAQAEILRNMSNDLLPRFLAVSMSQEKDSGKNAFKTDELLQRALLSLVDEED